MQLFAFDHQGRSIFANQADKRVDYYCIECGSVVHRRGGIHRQEHYYHVRPHGHCRLEGKGMTHIKTQLAILQSLPEGEGFLEYRFPSISRIADVAWLSEKVVFEVQCATISAEEVLARNRDYLSLGWQPVWILHDSRYNQTRLSAAEVVLRDSPHYFTNINGAGRGIIYDQFDVHHRGQRKEKMAPLPIRVERIHRIERSWPMSQLLVVKKRWKNWRYYFEGDLIATVMADYISEACDRERKYGSEQIESGWVCFLKNIFVRPYQLWFQMLLEKMCR